MSYPLREMMRESEWERGREKVRESMSSSGSCVYVSKRFFLRVRLGEQAVCKCVCVSVCVCVCACVFVSVKMCGCECKHESQKNRFILPRLLFELEFQKFSSNLRIFLKLFWNETRRFWTQSLSSNFWWNLKNCIGRIWDWDDAKVCQPT